MVSIICLAVATIGVLLFVIMQKKGNKYERVMENLEEDKFQLKDLYSVGFAWQEMVPVLGCKGFFANKIRTDVVLFYGEKYADFYTRVILAKSYTYAHLIFCFFGLISGMVKSSSSGLMIFVGIIFAIAIAWNVLNEPKMNVRNRADNYLVEFPNVVTKLALMIDSGMILREAWFSVTRTTNGELRTAMEQACELMRNGYSDLDAIYFFGQYSGTKEIKKFASSIGQGISKGSAELSALLIQQSSELWEIKRQRTLQKGEEAATKLVIPTTMMFVGIILVILVSAMNGMSL